MTIQKLIREIVKTLHIDIENDRESIEIQVIGKDLLLIQGNRIIFNGKY